MRAKIGKVFLLLFVLIFLFSLISCQNSQDKTRIAELEEQLNEYQQLTTEKTTTVTEENQAETTETLPEETGINFTPVIEKDLYIQGQTTNTFVLDNYLYTGGQGLNIFDISDKANPNLLGSINSDWVNKLYVEDDYAYIVYSGWDDETGLSKTGLKIIDVGDKKNPTEVADFSMDRNFYNVVIRDNYVFISICRL